MLEAELYKMLEGTADAAFVVDSYGVTRFWNHAAEKLFGYAASVALGRPCAELIEGHGPLGNLVCWPDCTVLQWFAAGREIPNFDLKTRTCAGCRLWVNVSILQFHDSRARRHYAVHLMRDIGQRKKSEELSEKLLQAAQELVALSTDPAHDVPVSPLSDQERKILRFLAKGHSPAEATAHLKITARTLRNHLYNVNRKLGTRNRLAAVVHATRRGLI